MCLLLTGRMPPRHVYSNDCHRAVDIPLCCTQDAQRGERGYSLLKFFVSACAGVIACPSDIKDISVFQGLTRDTSLLELLFNTYLKSIWFIICSVIKVLLTMMLLFLPKPLCDCDHFFSVFQCPAIDYTRHTLDGAACLLNSNKYFPSRYSRSVYTGFLELMKEWHKQIKFIWVLLYLGFLTKIYGITTK